MIGLITICAVGVAACLGLLLYEIVKLRVENAPPGELDWLATRIGNRWDSTRRRKAG